MADSTETVVRLRRTGTVISDRNAKTIIVGVRWSRRHPVYRKSIRRLSKFVAHDENSEAKRGDTVLIEEARPMSATKRWRLVSVITRGELAQTSVAEAGAAGQVASQ